MIDTFRRPRWAVAAAIVAVGFGLLTIAVGGNTLFDRPAGTASAGNIVPFVLWFNFLAGFAYVAAGVGLYLWRRWAAQVSVLIAATTILVFIAFSLHIFLGGAFETRTVGAMALRSLIWVVIATAAYRTLGCFQRGTLKRM